MEFFLERFNFSRLLVVLYNTARQFVMRQRMTNYDFDVLLWSLQIKPLKRERETKYPPPLLLSVS
jgi:hypothetical protein